jgi:hypothetical protein
VGNDGEAASFPYFFGTYVGQNSVLYPSLYMFLYMFRHKIFSVQRQSTEPHSLRVPPGQP